MTSLGLRPISIFVMKIGPFLLLLVPFILSFQPSHAKLGDELGNPDLILHCLLPYCILVTAAWNVIPNLFNERDYIIKHSKRYFDLPRNTTTTEPEINPRRLDSNRTYAEITPITVPIVYEEFVLEVRSANPGNLFSIIKKYHLDSVLHIKNSWSISTPFSTENILGAIFPLVASGFPLGAFCGSLFTFLYKKAVPIKLLRTSALLFIIGSFIIGFSFHTIVTFIGRFSIGFATGISAVIPRYYDQLDKLARVQSNKLSSAAEVRLNMLADTSENNLPPVIEVTIVRRFSNCQIFIFPVVILIRFITVYFIGDAFLYSWRIMNFIPILFSTMAIVIYFFVSSSMVVDNTIVDRPIHKTGRFSFLLISIFPMVHQLTLFYIFLGLANELVPKIPYFGCILASFYLFGIVIYIRLSKYFPLPSLCAFSGISAGISLFIYATNYPKEGVIFPLISILLFTILGSFSLFWFSNLMITKPNITTGYPEFYFVSHWASYCLVMIFYLPINKSYLYLIGGTFSIINGLLIYPVFSLKCSQNFLNALQIPYSLDHLQGISHLVRLVSIPFHVRNYFAIFFLIFGLLICITASQLKIQSMELNAAIISKLAQKDPTAYKSVIKDFFVSISFNVLREVHGVAFTIFINRVLAELSSRCFKNSLYAIPGDISPIQMNRIIDRGIKSITILLEKVLSIITTRAISIILIAFQFLKIATNALIIVILYNIAYIGVTFFLLKRRVMLKEEINRLDDTFSAKQVESLNNLDTIICCNKAEMESSLYRSLIEKYFQKKLLDRLLILVLHSLQGLIYCTLRLHILLLIYYNEKITEKIYSTMLVMQLLRQLDKMVLDIALAVREISVSLVDCKSFFILDSRLTNSIGNRRRKTPKEEAPEASENTPLMSSSTEAKPSSGNGILEFRNVSFSYSSDGPKVLDQVSFTISEMERVAIMGENGCGKSTLFYLLLRGYPYTGTIFYDGIDISTMSTERIVNEIGFVQDEGGIFNHSIEYNLKYGCGTVSEEKFLKICQILAIDKIAELKKEGYGYVVGMRGEYLSAGERQRLSIGRMLLRSPRVLIMDESLSKVDHDLVLSILGRLVEEVPTLILVTHSEEIGQTLGRIIKIPSSSSSSSSSTLQVE